MLNSAITHRQMNPVPPNQVPIVGTGYKKRKLLIILALVAVAVVVIAISLSLGLYFGLRREKPTTNTTHCDVAILGAGFAGTFAAYQLANRSGSRICLIEKLDRFGGRIFDVSGWPGGPTFGVGALRVTSVQLTMLALAHELGVELQKEGNDNELLRVRGEYFYRDVRNNASESNQMCRKAFHNLTCEYPSYPYDTDKAILSILLDTYNANKSVAFEHADFPHYVAWLFGDEGLAFIRESVRYNSLFTSVSIQGILDFFNHELLDKGLDPDRFYVSGGMSQYITKMLAFANQSNVQIYSSEPVLTINFDSSVKNDGFLITTPNYVFRAESVLCAIDPINLRTVRGDVVDSLTAAPEFNVILPKTLVIVTAWWPERWWEYSRLYRNLSRVVSHQNCFNTMDIPTFPYGRDQNVTRAVYDDGACLDIWRTLINGGNEDMLKKTVVSSLGEVFTDVEIPLPKALHGFVHENAWHLQVADSKISNQRIFEWSQHPIHGRNFSLIGEGYNLDYMAWCDGALKSTMWALFNYYNFTYPCLNDTGSPANCSSSVAARKPYPIRHNIGRFLFG